MSRKKKESIILGLEKQQSIQIVEMCFVGSMIDQDY